MWKCFKNQKVWCAIGGAAADLCYDAQVEAGVKEADDDEDEVTD